MTRPDSHRDQPHSKCCGNCKFAHLVAYKLDLLCFHGDKIEVIGTNGYPVESEYLLLAGKEVGLMDGDEYDEVWASRIVDSDEICDEWESEH